MNIYLSLYYKPLNIDYVTLKYQIHACFAMLYSTYAEMNEREKKRRGFQSDMLFQTESIILKPEELSKDKVKTEERTLRFV